MSQPLHCSQANCTSLKLEIYLPKLVLTRYYVYIYIYICINKTLQFLLPPTPKQLLMRLVVSVKWELHPESRLTGIGPHPQPGGGEL